MKNKFTYLLAFLFFTLIANSGISQTTYTVGATGQDFTTVQEAIDDLTVNDGDIIQIVDAVHTEFNISVTKSVTITGFDSETSTIQAADSKNNAEGRIFYVESENTVIIENLTITHGKIGVYGGAIYNGGTLTINNCVITDNEVEIGQAWEQQLGGGGIYNASILYIYSSEISNNRSGWHGGGIWMAHQNSELYVENCIIKDNFASNGGGGFGAYAGDKFEFKNTLIVNNRASSTKGGGIHISHNISPKLTLNSVTISDNYAGDYGGGIHMGDGELYIVNTIIAGNNSPGSDEESDVATYGNVYSQGYNIIGIDDGDYFQETSLDYEGTIANPFDPELDENYVPLLTSPCINYGPSNIASLDLMDTDVYGNPRVFDGNVDIIDIGAVELQDEPLPTYLIQVEQTSLDLGTIPLNTNTYGTVKIDNIGQATLTIDSVLANGGFELLMPGKVGGDSILYNKTITAHSTGELYVFVNSDVDSTFNGSLTIYSNATNNPEITVNLATVAASGIDYFKGTIVSNTNWCQDTVHIGGDVTVAKNVTLTICEGTVIDFLDDHTFTVNGLLQANGTLADTIFFTTNATEWGGLRFEDIENQAKTLSNLEYVRIEKADADAGNEFDKGGGIYLDETAELTIENSEIVNNKANNHGGGIFNAGLLTIESSLISQNSTINTSSNYGGGGVANKGELYIYNSAIYDNTSAYHGGGILNVNDNAILYLENDSITDNTASRAGGGIGNAYVKQVDIVNCLIANNTATSRKGGGIQNGGNSTGTINITSSTIYGNTASGGYYGGGIQNEKGTFNIINSIIAGNSAGTYDDVYNSGTLNSLGYNLIGNEDGYSFLAFDGDIVGTSSNPIDAMLNNDYSLSDSSIAINHGITDTTGLNLPATDLAGNPRIFDGSLDVIDIGAFELQQEPNENYILSISENSLDFVLVTVDSVSYLDIELKNLGFGIIEIDSVIAPEGYEVSIAGSQYNDTITDFLIQAYDNSVLTVKFAPTSAITFTGNILIKSNDDNEPEKSISVTGDGSGYVILSGEIANNTTICVDTVKVSGDVTIPNGLTLEICPGTVVEMQGNYAINVQGRLLAEGTETDTIVFTHVSSGDWGGIRFDGTSNANDSSKISYSIIEYGKADYGGALYIDDYNKLVFRNNILRNNAANYSGGAIYNKGTLVIENSIFEDNSANSSNQFQGGGAIANAGILAVTNTQIFNNHTNKHGGGICNMDMYAQLEISHCKITDNTASRSGGGIANYYAISVTIENTLITGNEASLGYGGAIHAGSRVGGDVYLKNVTIADNSASWGGDAIFNQAAKFNISHTLIYNCNSMFEGWGSGEFISEGYNFIDNIENDTWALVTGDIIGTNSNVLDPWLNADYTLSDSSMVINVGNPDGVFAEYDLADLTRVYGGTVDIGAYEFQGDKLLKDMVMNVDTFPVWFDNHQIGEQSYVLTRTLSLESGNDILRISSITAPTGFTIATSEEGTFENTLTDIEVRFDEEFTLYVRMEPTAEQLYEGVISINNNTGISVVEIPVSGYGANLNSSFIFVNTPPVIDGIVDNLWNDISHYRLAKSDVDINRDVEAKYKGVWDADSLYLLVQVVDDSLHHGEADIADDDNLELFIDFNNSKGESYDTDDYMIRFSYNTLTPNFVNGGPITGFNFSQVSSTATHLVYEIAVPWANATAISPNSGNEIGIELNVNDNDGSGIENQITWYSDAIDKDSNPSVFGTVILLDENGEDLQAPVFDLSHGETNFAITCEEDSVFIPVTIYNNGNARDLIYTVYNGIYDTTSIQNFSGDGATTMHSFTELSPYSSSLQLVIYIEGDFGDESEHATLFIEGIDYGYIEKGGPDFNNNDGDPFTSTYTFGKDDVQGWLSDGQLDISITNTSEVGDFAGTIHQVQLLIDKAPGNQGEISQGASLNIEIPVEVGSFPEGITEDLFVISSNDPSNSSDTVFFTIDKQVYPILEITQTQFNFGEVIEHHFGKDTLIITNTGCDTLFIDSIGSTNDYFFAHKEIFTIIPGDTSEVFIYFLPEEIGEFNEFMTIYSNDEDKTINVKGVTADTIPPQVMAAYVNDDRPDILVVEFDEEIQVFGSDGFTLNGGSGTITGINDVFTSSIEFTLSGDIVFGESLTMDYDSIAENVKDVATLENPMLSFSDVPVANNVEFIDDVPPTIVSAKVENANPDQVIIEFDEVVIITGTDGLSINGTTGSIDSFNGSGTKFITITLDANVLFGETLTLDYANGSGDIHDDAKIPNELDDVTGLTILNNVDYVDVFVPVFVSAKVEDATPNQIEVTFDEPVTTSDESGFSFTGTTGLITGVSGSGTATLIFTLDADVVFGENIEVSYVSASGDVTDMAASPNALGDFGPETVVNNVAYSGSSTDPEVTALSIEDANPNQVVVTLNEDVTLTDQTGFSISGITANISGVTGTGTSTLTFTLDVDVVYGDIVLLSYNDATGDVQAVDNSNPLVSFNNFTVTNNVAFVDTEAPTLQSAKVENASPTSVMLVFDENVAFSDATGFTINGTTGAITGATGSGNDTIFISLDAPVVFGESLTIDYDQPSGNVQDEAAAPNDLASFAGFVVANYVEFVDVTKPQVVSAVVENDNPFEVLVTFTEEVTYTDFTGITVNGTFGTITGISGDGTTVLTLTLDEEVVFGDVLSLDYSVGNITDLAASPNSLDDFTGITIVNNVEAETINPTILSAVIEDASPADIVVTFDETVFITDISGFGFAGKAGSLTNVSGSGTTVLTFTMDAPAVYWEDITLSYDGFGNVEDRVGNILMPVDFEVTNYVGRDENVAPTLLSATIEDAAPSDIVLEFDEFINAPDFVGFTVNGITNNIVGIAGTGTSTITLTIDTDIVWGDVLTLDYSGGNIYDFAKVPNALQDFATFSITNNVLYVDPDDPVLSSVTIEDDMRSSLEFTFNETIRATNMNGFTFELNGTGITPNAFSGDSTSILTFDFDVEFEYGDIVVMDYDAGLGNIVDASTPPNALQSIVDLEVTNNIIPRTDATLATIVVGEDTIPDFRPDSVEYAFELPIGATEVPEISAPAADTNAMVDIAVNDTLPGTTTITVTAEDGMTEEVYTVDFTVEPKHDATLADLKVDGTTVTDFDAATLTYDVVLPFGTTEVPVVTATANDADATLEITDATALPGATTVEVTAQDDTTIVTYTVNFTVAKNNDATLSDLKIDGTTITGFNADSLIYTVELPIETAIVPAVEATATDENASIEIVDADMVPGVTTVTVTAEDATTTNVYTINFVIEPNHDATLADIKVDGATISGFDSAVIEYFVNLPVGTTEVPEVTATATDVNALVEIDDADGIPGSTVITVTAEDDTTQMIYTVYFATDFNDATLIDLMVDGETVEGFDPATLEYDVELPFGTTEVPVVTAMANADEAVADIVDATALPGTTTITVTAPDGETQLVYGINFTVGVGIDELVSNLNVDIYPNPSNGLFNIEIVGNVYDEVSINIISVDGRVVYAQDLIYTDVIKIDASDLQKGMYFVKTSVNNNITIKQIVIE